MLRNRLEKLEKQLAPKKKGFKVWLCPQEPPPNPNDYGAVITLLIDDESLSDDEIKLQKRYLAEFEASKL